MSDDWELHNSVIDLTKLQGRHKGKYLAESFWNVLVDYGITEKLFSLTTDNASNMDTMLDELENIAETNGIHFDAANFRVRCFAHILNLCCKDIICTIGDSDNDASDDDENDEESGMEMRPSNELPVIAKLRKGVVAIRKSPQTTRDVRNAMQCPQHRKQELAARRQNTI